MEKNFKSFLLLLMMSVIWFSVCYGENDNIVVQLEIKNSINLEKLRHEDGIYKYIFGIKISISNNTDSTILIPIRNDGNEIKSNIIFILEMHDSDNGKIKIFKPIEDYIDKIADIRIYPHSKLRGINVMGKNLVCIPKKGPYKILGKFIFNDTNGEKIIVNSEPCILNVN